MFMVTKARSLLPGFLDPVMSFAFSMYQVTGVMCQEYLVRMFLPRVLEKPLKLRLGKEIPEDTNFRPRLDLRQRKEKNLLRKISEESVF